MEWSDIFNTTHSKQKPKRGMFESNVNMFDMSSMSDNNSKNKKSSGLWGGFHIPDMEPKGRGFGPKLNFFGMEEEKIPKKSDKFYNKVKGKKLDNFGGFGDWGKLDDYSSEFKLGF